MKKGFIFLTLLFFAVTAFAQNSVTKGTEENSTETYEHTISWEPAENARAYSVQIQQYDANGNWIPFFSEICSVPFVQVTFTPGRYRISVDPVNYLGKTVQQNQWLRFRILTQEEWEKWQKEKDQKENQPVYEEEEDKGDRAKKQRIWFTALRLNFELPYPVKYTFICNFHLGADIVDLGWFYWGAGVNLTPIDCGSKANADWKVSVGLETSANFAWPNKYVSPHAGIKAGYEIVNKNNFSAAEGNLFAAAEAGILFVKYVDLKVYGGWQDLLGAREPFAMLSLGAKIPLK